MNQETRLLTLSEVALRLRVSRAHLSKLSRGIVPGTKPLPVVRLGRRVLVRVEALEEWLLGLDSRRGFR